MASPSPSDSPMTTNEPNPRQRTPLPPIVRRVLWWVTIIGALAIIADHYFGGTDTLISRSEAPTRHIARVENFDRPDAATTAFDGADAFLPTQEKFAIAKGQAVRSGTADAMAIAYVPGNRLGAVAMRIRGANPGSGLVFRYRDPGDYWLITPASDKVWELIRVKSGTQEVVRKLTRLIGTDDTNLSVEFDGSGFVVRSAGIFVVAVSDDYLATAAGAGFTARGAAGSSVSFDDVVLYYPPGKDVFR